jgi:hypothetical protein
MDRRLTACGIPSNGIGALRIMRPQLVDEIIASASDPEVKHVFLRGARGFGKTVLLEQIARKLQVDGFRVFVAQWPVALESWFVNRKSLPPDQQPQFFVVDEVQQGFVGGISNSAVAFLAGKDYPPEKLPYVTIFAGIPDKESESSMLENRWDIERLLLTEGDLLTADVLDFFWRKLQAVQGASDAVAQAVDCSEVAAQVAHGSGPNYELVSKIIRFVLAFTNGHCYACLKMIEYLVEHIAMSDLQGEDYETTLRAAITSAVFEPTIRRIESRCFDHHKVDIEKVFDASKRTCDATRAD